MNAGRTHIKAPGAAGPIAAPKAVPPAFRLARAQSVARAGAPMSIQAQLTQAARYGHQLGSVPVEGPTVAERLRAAASGGRHLDADLRSALEPRLGADLGAVRIHRDAGADALAHELDAAAFTTGPHIYFRAGAFRPRTPEGLGLLAHEVEHTRQQAAGPVAGTPAPGGVALSDPGDRYERAAAAAAERMTAATSTMDVHGAAPLAPAAAGPVRTPTAAPAAVQRAPLVPVQRFRLLPRGKIRGLLPRALRSGGANMYEHFFGEEAKRRAITDNTATVRARGLYGAIDDVQIPSTNGNTLRGRLYHPLPAADGAPRPGDGLTVLVLSGSGGSSENYTEPIAREYTDLGADVLAVNYRGFGGSGTRGREGQGGAPTQAGVYEDAMAMFQYLRDVRGVPPQNLVVHGYSFGGGVAADLVSELAKRRVPVRGLVLHSAIPSTPEPARAQLGGGAIGAIAGALTGGLIGQFDTRAKLARIAAAQPDLPVHFTSGGPQDYLGIASNDLAQRATALFSPGAVTQDAGPGGHLATISHLRSPGTQAGLRRVLNSEAYQRYQQQQARQQARQIGDLATQTLRDLELRDTARVSDIYSRLEMLQGVLGRTRDQGPTARFAIRAVRLPSWPAPVEVELAYPGGGAFDRALAERQVRDLVAPIAGGPVDVRVFGPGLYGRNRAATR